MLSRLVSQTIGIETWDGGWYEQTRVIYKCMFYYEQIFPLVAQPVYIDIIIAI